MRGASTVVLLVGGCLAAMVVAPVSPTAAPVASAAAPTHLPGLTVKVSVPGSGGSDAGISGRPSLDDAGDVVFTSNAPLVSSDANSAYDIYLRTADGTTRLISRTSAGAAGNGVSMQPAISRNGRFIVFSSTATNLATSGPAGDGTQQVFLYDRDPSGNGLDGSDYSLTMASLSTTSGVPNGASDEPAVAGGTSAYVAFRSAASDIVSSDTNGDSDVFLSHLGSTSTVSSGLSGDQANGSSADPDVVVTSKDVLVAFDSIASNLTSGDTNGFSDVFLRTIPLPSGAPSTTMVSFDGAGNSTNPSMSSQGGRIVYASTARFEQTPGSRFAYVSFAPFGDNAGDVSGGEFIGNPVISGDGGYVAFEEAGHDSFNHVGNNSHNNVFLFRISTGVTVGVSGSSSNNQANANSAEPSLAAHGFQIAFASTASNLVSGDTNHAEDVFLRTRDSTPPPAPTVDKAVLQWSRTGKFTASVDDDKGTLQSGAVDLIARFGTSTSKSGLNPLTNGLISIHKNGSFTSTPDQMNCNQSFNQGCLDVASGTHYYLILRAVDLEGNLSPYAVVGPIKIDVTAPRLSVSVSPVATASETAHLSWKASDSGVGLASSFTLMTIRGRVGSPFSSQGTSSTMTGRSKRIGLKPGWSYYFTIIAQDKLGNANSKQVGPVTAPTTAASLTFPKSWPKRSSSHYYGGKAAVSVRHGAAFVVKQSHRSFEVTMAVTVCATCGSFEVEPVDAHHKSLASQYGPPGVWKVSLHHSSTRHSVLISYYFEPRDDCHQTAVPCKPDIAGFKVINTGPAGAQVAIEGLDTHGL